MIFNMIKTEDKVRLAKFLLDDAFNDMESNSIMGDKEEIRHDIEELEDIITDLWRLSKEEE